MATTDQAFLRISLAIAQSLDLHDNVQLFLNALVVEKHLQQAVFLLFPEVLQHGEASFDKQVIPEFAYPEFAPAQNKPVDCIGLISDFEDKILMSFSADNPAIKNLRWLTTDTKSDMVFIQISGFGFLQLIPKKKSFGVFSMDKNLFSKEETELLPALIEKFRLSVVHCFKQSKNNAQVKGNTSEKNTGNLGERIVKTHQTKILSTISHETLNPLNTIKGHIILLRSMLMDHNQTAYLDIIDEKRAQLESVLKKILNNTSLHLKPVETVLKPFDLFELFHQLENKIKEQAQKKGIVLKTTVDEQIKTLLVGDQTRLFEALLFLAENAVRYATHGQIHIGADCIADGPETSSVKFYVNESGGAFMHIDVEGLMQFLKQEDESTTRSHEIMGLGLSLSKYYVDCMGGKLEFEKESGPGTNFSFTLILLKEKDTTVSSLQTDMIENKLVTRNIKLLLVDDDHFQLEMNRKLMKDWNLFLAEGGREAIEVLQKNPDIQVVLMDLNMPGMDGISATRIIRNELKSNVVIIAYSGEAHDEKTDECLAAGMNGFVSKTDDVTPIIETALGRHDLMIPAERVAKIKLFENMRALVIDGNSSIQWITAKTLVDAGCEVDMVRNGSDALEMILENSYNFILADYHLSGIDVFELAIRLKEKGIQTPLIAYSADNSPELLLRAKESGLKGPLLKSFYTYEKLAYLIQDIIASKPASESARLYDLTNLDTLVGNDRDELRSLVEIFIKYMPDDLEQLNKCLNEGNYTQVSRLAHKIKSSAKQYQIKSILDDFEKIERHEKLGVSETEVVFLVSKVTALINRVLLQLSEDFQLSIPQPD
jgi:CheY-like chemotaxis protein/signal transduction histidine kinase